MRTSWIRAVILVVVLVGGVITPVAPVGDARATPSGFVTIPDANVHEDLPVDDSVAISKEDLEGSVMVSDNASTTEIVVTTSERAEGYLDNGTSVGGGSLALVIQDDMNHAGREVAIPADAVKGAIGRIPEAVYGTHEDGSEWTSQVRAQSGLLIFEVPHFSSNTVSFSGEVNLSGSYNDGSSVAYEVNSIDSVRNFNVSLTGKTTEEWDNETGSLAGSDSLSLSISGNMDPTGPGGEPSVSAQGEAIDYTEQADGTDSYSFSNPPKYVGTASIVAETTDGSTVNVKYEVVVDGTVEASGTFETNEFATYKDLTVNESINDSLTYRIASEDTSSPATITAGQRVQASAPQSFNVSFDTGESLSVTNGNGSGNVDLSTSTSSISTDTNRLVSVSVDLMERTQTHDPRVKINGEKTSYSGTLVDGETVSLSTNESWITQSNTVNVQVGDRSLSADAPTPSVSLDYRHEATDQISVNYTADGWTERYNTSRAFASTQEDPTITVPFQGTITEITRLEERTDGGSWSEVPSSRYALDGSELTVQMDDGDSDGDVDAGTEMSVRVTGRHVEAVNGEITVTDPILPGEDTDVGFRIDSTSTGFYIDLSEVPDGGVRYSYEESWSNPEDHMIVTASGEKRLKFPNAPAGGSARVTYIPVMVTPESGDAKVSVADPDEPTITMGPGSSSGDDVTIRYLEASTGTTYQLYSTSRDRIVAKETADAGTVSFVEDDSGESLMINTSSSGGGGGGVGFEGNAAADYGSERPILVMGALAALVIGLVWATGRTGIRGRQRWALVGAVSLGLGLISLESLYPGAISQRIGEGLGGIFSQVGTVVPIAGIAAVAVTGYMVVSWWQSRKAEASTPDTKVTFSLGDKKK